LPAVGVSRKNRKIISLVSGKEFLTALCFQACQSIGLSKSGDIPKQMRMFMDGKTFIAAGSGFSGGKMEQKRKAKARKRRAETQTAA